MTGLSWNTLLVDQLDWIWTTQTRPRLEGLTDEEYFWEPAPDAWSLRRRGASSAPTPVGDGPWRLDWGFPAPVPAPVTTIAWRLAHVIVGVLAQRNASHFDAPGADYDSFAYAGSATGALAQLDEQYDRWVTGVRALGEDGLRRPCGPAEGPFGREPLAVLVLHINREAIHHLAEVSLLRDLYPHRGQG